MVNDTGQIWVVVFNPGLPDSMEHLEIGWRLMLRRKLLMDETAALFVDDLGEPPSTPKVWAVRDFPPMFHDCGLKDIVHARAVLESASPERSGLAERKLLELALAYALLQPQAGYFGRSVVIPECARESAQGLRRTMEELEAGSSKRLREIILYKPDGSFEILPQSATHTEE